MASPDSQPRTSQAYPTKPILSVYTDYRQYLCDFYQYKRALHRQDSRPYSYAMFSAAADIKSPSYLKMIIEGQRNLSPGMIGRFAKALQLSKEESEEFRALVLYNQETEPLLRNQHLKVLSDLRISRQMSLGEINQQTWEKVPNWLTWILLAMVDQKGVEFSAEAIQDLLCARMNLSGIDSTLEKLFASGELVRDSESGEVRKARKLIESPESVPVALVRKLQAELMNLGFDSLFRDAPSEREFGALTLSLTDEEFEQVRFELRQLRKRLHRDFAAKRESSKGDRVYQLNVQFFPMTKKNEKDLG